MASKKYIYSSILIVFFVLTGIYKSLACNVELEVVDGKKDTYKKGNVLTVKVRVTLTHRFCDIDISKTDFKPNGLKIKSATDWKEVSPGIFERKLKIQVLENDVKDLSLSVSRTCNKHGGHGFLNLATVKQ